MKRITWVKIHLYISGFSIVFFSLYIVSGSLHLFFGNEAETKQTLTVLKSPEHSSEQETKTFFANELKSRNPDYRFDYMKGSSQSMMTRPTTRTYYRLSYSGEQEGYVLTEHQPSWQKRFMEFHKGHGARSTRKIMAVIAILFFLSVCSGVWLGLSVAAYRGITLVTLFSGLVAFVILFSL